MSNDLRWMQRFQNFDDAYFFDVVAYGTITREALKQHIDEKGISIYHNDLSGH